MSDSPPSQMTRVPTPLIPAVRELSRLHRQGWTPQILSGLQSLISAIDSSIEFSIDINSDSSAIAELTQRIESLEAGFMDINSDSTSIAELTQRIESLEAGFMDINSDSTSIAELTQRIEKLEATVESLPGTEGEKRTSQPPRKAAKKSSSSKKHQPPPPEPLIQSRLAERLGIDTSTLTRRRNRDDFEQWVQSLDPDGFGWEYNWEEKQFYPI
ncbi:hypothetical protein [Coleofasciculus sp. FACHB-501]|uniref:hypothetical protein n=1 Tax=Cyanophyceae TaxID=3028117 RepID=UPI001686D5FB|nr:hypothetical protein [Coleofasciculus sp. FACHB-501]MBD1838861.1 hypothetical protein [Coleofasciculus sp. FACHB-501]